MIVQSKDTTTHTIKQVIGAPREYWPVPFAGQTPAPGLNRGAAVAGVEKSRGIPEIFSRLANLGLEIAKLQRCQCPDQRSDRPQDELHEISLAGDVQLDLECCILRLQVLDHRL